MVGQLDEELIALRKAIERRSADPALKIRGPGPSQTRTHLRHLVTLDIWQTDDHGYKEYARAIRRLLDLKEADLEPGRIHIEGLIPKGAMGDPNSLYQLQNYVAGLSEQWTCPHPEGSLDLERSFEPGEQLRRCLSRLG